MSTAAEDPYLADSRQLHDMVAQLAARELAQLGPNYKLTTRDLQGKVVAVGERSEPPYRYVALWVATVEGLRSSRERSTPLADHVASVNVTSDAAPLLLAGLRRVFPELFTP